MSYDIKLLNPVTGKIIELPFKHLMSGGIYQAGGSNEARLNVTYNYSKILGDYLPPAGIRTLYGMTGTESLPILAEATRRLANDVDEDYWKATEGNVKQALLCLQALAQMRPDGVWEGD